MIPLGLKVDELKLFEKTLRSTHEFRVRIGVLNLSGAEISDVTDRLLDGQVNFDSTGEATRQLSLTLDDPGRKLSLDSSSPDDGALYADRMIRVEYDVYTPSLGRWVEVPLFTGPITAMNRNGSQVELTCLGKEHLAGGQAWRPLNIGPGTNVVTAIKTILRERAGETLFAFPTSRARVPKPGVSLGAMSSPWAAAVGLAKSIGCQLYYDGAGVCRLRGNPRTSVFTFNGDSVLTDPAVTYDLSSIINTVLVKGKKAAKAKQAVTATAIADRSHPMSPYAIGRNGEPRHYVELVENDKIRSNAQARAIANSTLRDRLLEGVTCDFDALPQPHLEPLDIVRLNVPGAAVTFVLHRASIPLVHSGVMSVGTNRRVTPNRSRIR